jgi:hypothetical protein
MCNSLKCWFKHPLPYSRKGRVVSIALCHVGSGSLWRRTYTLFHTDPFKRGRVFICTVSICDNPLGHRCPRSSWEFQRSSLRSCLGVIATVIRGCKSYKYLSLRLQRGHPSLIELRQQNGFLKAGES